MNSLFAKNEHSFYYGVYVLGIQGVLAF